MAAIGKEAGKPLRMLMNDLIYAGVVVAFFVASGLYVRFCEKL